MGGVSSIFGGGGEADAAEEAAATSAAAQREAAEYLEGREEIPLDAISQLAGVYGVAGGTGSREAVLERAMTSPFYAQAQREGEEALLRNLSATGGLRSGGAQESLASLNQQLLNQMYQQELGGLQYLAGQPTYGEQIGAYKAGIGETLAQGQVASAQAEADEKQRQQEQLMQLAQIGMGFSDIRLKDNIVELEEKNGHKWFSWDWNKKAEDLFGLSGSSEGVMAQLIKEYRPDAIQYVDGYMTVNYEMLGVIDG